MPSSTWWRDGRPHGPSLVAVPRYAVRWLQTRPSCTAVIRSPPAIRAIRTPQSACGKHPQSRSSSSARPVAALDKTMVMASFNRNPLTRQTGTLERSVAPACARAIRSGISWHLRWHPHYGARGTFKMCSWSRRWALGARKRSLVGTSGNHGCRASWISRGRTSSSGSGTETHALTVNCHRRVEASAYCSRPSAARMVGEIPGLHWACCDRSDLMGSTGDLAGPENRTTYHCD